MVSWHTQLLSELGKQWGTACVVGRRHHSRASNCVQSSLLFGFHRRSAFIAALVATTTFASAIHCRELRPGVDASYYTPRHNASGHMVATPSGMIASLWRLTLCAAPGALSGRLIIERRAGCPPDLVAYPGADTPLWNHVGPDDFLVELAGPELSVLSQAPSPRNCSYSFPFNVSVPGQYHLRVLHLYEKFAAVDERITGWAPIHLDDILGGGTTVNFGGTDAAFATRLHAVLIAGKGLTRCSSHEAMGSGRWLVAESPTTALHAGPVPVTDEAIGDAARGWPIARYVNISSYRWVPTTCARKPLVRETLSSCLARRHVLVIGDSQMRVWFNGLVRQLQGGSGRLAVKGLSQTCVPGALSLCYHYDPFARKAIKTINALVQRVRSRASLLVIINVGHHAASNEHWRVERYYKAVYDLLHHAVVSLAGNNALLLWVAAQATPPGWSPSRVRHKDWRTPPRLRAFAVSGQRAFNTLTAALNVSNARSAARHVTGSMWQRHRQRRQTARVLLQYVDAYTPSVAVANTARDGSHITQVDFQALLREMVFLAAGCRVRHSTHS